jgi:hypothetical protein
MRISSIGLQGFFLGQHLLSSRDDVIYGEPTHSGKELFVALLEKMTEEKGG